MNIVIGILLGIVLIQYTRIEKLKERNSKLCKTLMLYKTDIHEIKSDYIESEENYIKGDR